MKNIILLIAFLVLSSITFAQQGTKTNSTAPYFQKNVRVKDTLGVNKCIILNGDTITNFGTAGPENDPIWNFEKSLYPVYTDTINKLATKTDLINLTPIDTTNISDSLRIAFEKIDAKVNLTDSTTIYATPTQVLAYGFLTAEVDGSTTNEIQDTTEIAGLKTFVESYSINSFTETDPIWNADTTNVPRLTTANIYTKANTFNSSVILPNIATYSSATNMVVLNGTTLSKDVIVDITDATLESVTTDSLTVNSIVVIGGESVYIAKQSMLDDATIILPTATCGYGNIVVNDGTTWVNFVWTVAGVVTLVSNTADVDDADTDTLFCVFDSGTTVTIKNRLGATRNARLNLHYSPN